MGGLWFSVLYASTTLAAAPAPAPSSPPGLPVPPGVCFRESNAGPCVPVCAQFVLTAACDRYPDVVGEIRPLGRRGR